MRPRNKVSLVGILLAVILAAANSGCGGGAASLPPAIIVSLSPSSATVQGSATAQFTATVTNDSANQGVTWKVSCSTVSCGSVSPASTASGAATIYTAPGMPPAADQKLTLTATSVADPRKSVTATITVPAVTISASPSTATVNAAATAQFIATVTNDTANKGVNWTVSCSATSCGSVSPVTTPSGTATTYTAPGPPGVTLMVKLTATSVADTTKAASVAITVPTPPINVSLSETTFTVPPQATTQFTATVSNDPSGRGVTWSMTCNGATCGSISAAATASGAPTIYTAPGPPGVTLMVTLTATSVADTTKAASVAITVPTTPVQISVSVSPASVTTVLSGGTQPFTATVTNDPNNAGVTWQVVAKLTCDGVGLFGGYCQVPDEPVVVYLPCSGCGTFSAANTASGVPMTYTAPAHLSLPSKAGYYFCWYCAGALGVVATSVTNTASTASAGLILPQISVSVSPGSATVALSRTQQFTATLKNDGTKSGVTWSLTLGGAACAPGCGTITPTRTPSGAAATYTAPANPPATPLVRVIATSVEDPTVSPGVPVTLTMSSGTVACSIGSDSESLLKGQYAFELTRGQGTPAVVGSFTADGTGKIIGGEEDLFFTTGIDAAASGYAVGPDRRGCLVLTSAGNPAAGGGIGLSFSFSLGPLNSSGIATSGRINETTGQRTSAGVIRLQDPTSFVASQFKGSYAMGLIGYDLSKGGRVAMVGTFTADGVSAISSGTLDINDVGTITSDSTSTPGGTFTCCDANGRGALTLQVPALQVPGNPGIGFYMINGGDAFLLSANTSPTFQPFGGVGEATAIPSGTTFTPASLNGSSVLHATAQSANGPIADIPIVDIATVSTDGTSAMTVNDNVNNAGTFSTSSTAFNYAVASNGRVTLSGGTTPPVLYLYGPNQGFLLGTDSNVTFGILEPQAAGPFSNASFSGAYVLGTESPSGSNVTTESGVLTADGNGNAAGTVDQSSPTGLTQNQSLNLTYSFPANGVGDVGSGTTAIMISGNKVVFINNTDPNPTITVVER